MSNMEQFKNLLDEMADTIKTDLTDRNITQDRTVLMGLMVQYLENLLAHSKAQDKFVEELYQKSWSSISVENVEVMQKRCVEIAALSRLLYEEFENETKS